LRERKAMRETLGWGLTPNLLRRCGEKPTFMDLMGVQFQ